MKSYDQALMRLLATLHDARQAALMLAIQGTAGTEPVVDSDPMVRAMLRHRKREAAAREAERVEREAAVAKANDLRTLNELVKRLERDHRHHVWGVTCIGLLFFVGLIGTLAERFQWL